MSIDTEIDRLYRVRNDLIDAIEERGVTVPAGSKLDDLVPLIRQIGGVEVKASEGATSVCIIDRNGYIGQTISEPSTLKYKNWAIIDKSSDYSATGQGTLTTTDIVYGTEEIGGKNYNTVTINGQTWTTENLDLSDSGISETETGTPTSITIPASFYYKDDQATYGKYGRLYNGFAMLYLDENRDTIIPGWRIPTVEEWQALATFIEQEDGYSSTGDLGQCGTKLKINDDTEWNYSNGISLWGFNILPAGERSVNSTGTDAYKNGIDFGRNSSSTIWSSTYYSGSGTSTKYSNPWVNNTKSGLGIGINNICNAYSIRLIKDNI